MVAPRVAGASVPQVIPSTGTKRTSIDINMLQGPTGPSNERLRVEYEASCWSLLRTSMPGGIAETESVLDLTCNVTNLSIHLVGIDSARPRRSTGPRSSGSCRYTERVGGHAPGRSIAITLDGNSISCVESQPERVAFGTVDVQWGPDENSVRYTGWCTSWPDF
jgi:hypothetical protein